MIGGYAAPSRPPRLPAGPGPGLPSAAVGHRAPSPAHVETDGSQSRGHRTPAAGPQDRGPVSGSLRRRPGAHRAASPEHDHGHPAATRGPGPARARAGSRGQPTRPAPAQGPRPDLYARTAREVLSAVANALNDVSEPAPGTGGTRGARRVGDEASPDRLGGRPSAV